MANLLTNFKLKLCRFKDHCLKIVITYCYPFSFLRLPLLLVFVPSCLNILLSSLKLSVFVGWRCGFFFSVWKLQICVGSELGQDHMAGNLFHLVSKGLLKDGKFLIFAFDSLLFILFVLKIIFIIAIIYQVKIKIKQSQ